jgi:hypothetical protein
MKRSNFIFLFLLVIFFSCKKVENRSCYKGRGEEVSKEISIEGIERLKLGSNIRFVLIQDSSNRVIIKTGKNLINFIKLTKENDHLEIQNENDCEFLRYGKNDVLVELHISSVRQINFEGSEPLTNEGVLSWGLLSLTASDNATEIDLHLQMDSLYFTNPHAWPILKLTGQSKFCQINIEGDAKVNLRYFNVSQLFTYVSESSQYGEINLENTLKFVGQLRGNGDVGYWNEPTEMHTNYYGKGQFVKLQ